MKREFTIAIIATLTGAILAFLGSFIQFQMSQKSLEKDLIRSKLESAYIKSEELKLYVNNASTQITAMIDDKLTLDHILKGDRKINPLSELNMINTLYISDIKNELEELNIAYEKFDESKKKMLVKLGLGKHYKKDLFQAYSELIIPRLAKISEKIKNLQKIIISNAEDI